MLVAFITPVILGFFLLHQQKREVRREVKRAILRGMDESELTQLSFSKRDSTSLKWEHETEFEYRGTMYDVVRTHETRDSIFYTCWLDHAETKINRQLATWVYDAVQSDPEQNQRNGEWQWFYKTLIAGDTPLRATSPLSEELISNQTQYAKRWTSTEASPPTPPPIFC